MKHHELKCWPDPFEASRAGLKHYEVRSNLDRRFEVGDVLILREFNPDFSPPGSDQDGDYTGEVLYRTISYITRGGTFGLPSTVDVLGLEPRQ